ncbi:MAG: enoyl-CoA hydratase-related protein [Pseudomonadales bacterium]
MSNDIDLDISNGVALITFNRPEAMNTFTSGMMTGLGEAYQACDADDEVRVVVVTGAGKAFCAGADLSGGAETFDEKEDMDFSSSPLSFQAQQVRKPVIAACNGHAIGVGLGIASQCDMRIMAAQGKYGFLQAQRGVIADFNIHHVLPRMIGLEAALEMILTGKRYSGTEIGELGFARRVASAEDVLPLAMDMARDMAENCAPLITGMAKRMIWDGLDRTQAQAQDIETRALHQSMGKPDALEGGMAFFEKRKPNWTGSAGKDWPDWL